MINHSINNKVFTQTECVDIINFCVQHGEPFSYSPNESWDCRHIHNKEFKEKIITTLINNYKTENFKLWFDFDNFNLKNFLISLTSYYNGKYLNLHKDEDSDLTSVIVLSDGFDGGQFALSDSNKPDIHFNKMDNITTYDLEIGDMISFNGNKTYHGVLPVANGTRYALNIWMANINSDRQKRKVEKTLI
jgi:hypothetical protein